jgi:CHAT domain-containing protein
MYFLNALSRKSVICGLFTYLIFSTPTIIDAQSIDRGSMQRTLTDIMNNYRYSNPTHALELLDSALIVTKDEHWPEQQLLTWLYKSIIAEDVNLIDSLSLYLNSAQACYGLYRTQIDAFEIGNIVANELAYMRGMYHIQLGDYNKALSVFKQNIFENGALIIQDSLQTFNNVVNIGRQYVRLMEYEMAEDYYNMAKSVLPKFHNNYNFSERDYQYQLAFLQIAFGRVEFYKANDSDVNNYEKALNLLYSSMNLISGKLDKHETFNLQLTAYELLVNIYLEGSNYDSALYCVEKTIVFSKYADNERQFTSLINAVKVHRAINNFEKTKLYLKLAQAMVNSQYKTKHPFKCQIHYEIGKTYASQDKWTLAINEYQKALLELADDSGFNYKDNYQYPVHINTYMENEFLTVLLLKAEALYARYKKENNFKDLKFTIATYLKSTEVMSQLRMGFQNEDSKRFLSSIMLSSYENAIKAAFEAYATDSNKAYLDNALFFMEKSKAAQLLESINDLSAKNNIGIPSKVLKEENKLKGKIFYWKHFLSDKRDSVDIHIYRQELLEVQEKYELFIKSIEEKHPEYYDLKYASKIITLDEIMRSPLFDEEPMIEYFYGDEHLYILGVSKKGTAFKQIEVAQVNNNVNAAIEILNNDSKHDFEQIGYSLYQQLIAPVKSILPNHGRLLIIPDGVLGYIPFGTLISQPAKRKGASTNYLLKQYTVAYDYSMTLSKAKKGIKKPEFKYNYVGYAPGYAQTQHKEVDHPYFSPLSFNISEVENANTEMGGMSFIDDQATEANFRAFAPEAKIIHLALHGSIYDNKSSQTALYFDDYLTANTDSLDGILHLFELYNLPLNANLVMLSGCETGSGGLARGEGIISLGRAFQYAGCPSVAMSLWQVNDRCSALIVEGFFKNLKAGMPKDEALRSAKLSFLDDPKNKYFTHPYYWSGLVLTGDYTPIESPNLYVVVLITIIALMLTVLLVWMRKKKQSNQSV